MIGYRNYNLDIIWWFKEGFNREPKFWMLIEEKRHMSCLRSDQHLTYEWLDKKIKSLNDATYKGFHLIQFENTSPDDGKIYLDCKEITKECLIKFLSFK